MRQNHGNTRYRTCTRHALATLLILVTAGWHIIDPAPVTARSIFNPSDPFAQNELQSLVYASSSTVDVQRVLGPPDEIIRSEQMYPVIENHYYYEQGGTGAATLLVFQNGLLMGMHYVSPKGQLVDMTSFLTNNGDLRLNYPSLAGYRSYYRQFPMWGGGMF